MANYFVSYDIKSPDMKHGELFQAILSCGRALHLHENQWFISSQRKDKDIFDAIEPHIDTCAGDKLLIVNASNDRFYGCASDYTLQELKKHWEDNADK